MGTSKKGSWKCIYKSYENITDIGIGIGVGFQRYHWSEKMNM